MVVWILKKENLLVRLLKRKMMRLLLLLMVHFQLVSIFKIYIMSYLLLLVNPELEISNQLEEF